MADPVHPQHYKLCTLTREVADATQHLPHPLATAIEYIFRAGLKESSDEKTDLQKAVWWLHRMMHPSMRDTFFPAWPDDTASSTDNMSSSFFEYLEPLAIVDVAVVLLSAETAANIDRRIASALGKSYVARFSYNSIRNLINAIFARIEELKEED